MTSMSRNLTFNMNAKDQSVSSTFSSMGDAGNKFTAKIGSAISSVGDKIGGEVGELVSQVGEGFEKIAEGGTTSMQKLAVGSGVIAGLGVALQAFASKGEASENQLKAAVIATGQSWDDYEGKVNKAVSTEAKYAHDSADTTTALRTLDTATGSMDTSLADLNVTTDLAAAKHESLSEAAQQIALIYAGNTKILKQYGIDLKVTAGNTDEANAAITALGGKLSGQAAAAADTFSGKVAAVKTQVEDWGEKVAGFIGGPLTMLGTVTGAVTGVMEIGASAIELVKSKHAAAGIAALAQASAEDRLAASATLAAAAETDLAASTAETDTVIAASATGYGALAVAAGTIGVSIAAVVEGGQRLGQISPLITNMFEGTSDKGSQIKSLADVMEQAGNNAQQAAEQYAVYELTIGNIGADAQTAGISISSVADAITGSDEQFNSLIETFKKAGGPISDDTILFKTLRGEYTDGKTSIDAMNASQTAQTAATVAATQAAQKHNDAVHANNEILNAQAHQYGDSVTAIQSANKAAYSQIQSTQAATAAMQLENDAAGLLTAALNQFNTGTLSVAQAQTALNSATLQANTTLKTNKGTLDQHTQAGIDDAQAIQGQVAALQASAEATAKTTGSSKQATTTYKDQATQLLDNIGKQWGIHSAVYATYQSLLDVKNLKLPPTIVDVNASQALAQLAAVKSAAEAISTPVVLSARIASGRVNSGHASGGTVGGQTIDEFGYEALNLPNGTTVIPHGQTQQMMRGAGGQAPVVNIYVQSLVPTYETGKVIADALNQAAVAYGPMQLRSPWLAA